MNQNIKRNNKYICITRPCRFVKSLTASMLTAYYSKAFDSHFLFDNLKIAKEKTYPEYLNKYHTIFINIIDVFNEKDKNINAMIQDLTSCIVKEMSAFNPKISFNDSSSLYLCLNDFYLSEKEKFVIVIDEWDAPCVKIKKMLLE